VTTLLESGAARRLARELGSLRADVEAIKEAGRSTQLDYSTMLYPLIVRDPGSGDVLGTIGQQTDGGIALNRVGGPAPPAPTAPTLTPLMSGVLVEWDGKFTDPNYVVAAARAALRGTAPVGVAARAIVARGAAAVGTTGDIPPGKLEAARLILARLHSGQPIFEDWTWHGCPSVVGTWNDVLLDEFEASIGQISGDAWYTTPARSFLANWIDDAEAAIEAAANPPPGSTSGGIPIPAEGGTDPGDWYIPRTPDSPEKLAAANAILARIRSGNPIGTDWTWSGAPAGVTEWADDLQNEWRPSGRSAEVWLQAYVAVQDTRPSNFGHVGIHVGPPGFPTDPSNMVGVLTRAGQFPVSPVTETIEVRLVGYNDSYPPVAGPASDSVQCTPDQVVAQEVIDGIITETKLAAEAVSTGKMRLASVQAEILAAQAVRSQNLAPAAVTGPAIASSAVTADNMSANAVYADVLQSFSVIAGKIAAGSVSAAEILANSITADKLTTGAIQTGTITAGSVTTDALAALSVTSDKIASNAVTAGHVRAGAITADKLAALLVLANRMIAGDPTGTRAEMNQTGFEAWRGATKTFDVDAATGVFFAIGQIATNDVGSRIVMNPGGSQPDTLRFYPSNNEATWSSIDSVSWGNGTVSGIRIVGSGTSSTANRGMVVVRDQYASLLHGRTDLTYWGSEIWVEQAFTRNKSATVDLIIDQRLTPQNGPRRVSFINNNTSGAPIPSGHLQYQHAADDRPWLWGVNQGCGLKFDANELSVTTGSSQTFGNIKAAGFPLSSSETVKTDVQPLAVDSWAVIPGAPSREWFYRWEVEDEPHLAPDGSPILWQVPNPDWSEARVRATPDRHPDKFVWVPADPPPRRPARKHLFPIAEDLRRVAPSMVRDGDRPEDATVDLRDIVGLLWDAVARLIEAQQRGPTGPPRP
jgi:hypothetical protein